MFRHFAAVLKEREMKGPIKIELGAGKRKLPGWVSVDMAPVADIQCNLDTDSLPFEDGSIDEIYSSHFLEHFYHAQLVGHILPECLRVLKSGGIFNVAVPDASIYIKAYLDRRPCPEVIPLYRKAYFFDSFIDSINYIAYMGGDHRHMFDSKNLFAMLNNNGFVDVKIRNFDPSIDIERRREQSIYCIAIKP